LTKDFESDIVLKIILIKTLMNNPPDNSGDIKKRRRRDTDSSQPSPQNIQISKKTRILSSDCEFEEESDLPTNYNMETNTPTVVTLSENDILKIAKTVKSFLIEDINNIVEEKQKPILNELSQLKIKNANLERQIEQVRTDAGESITSMENVALKKEIRELRQRCDDMEQHSRKYMLRITGVPSSNSENTDQIVLDMAEKLKVQMTINDIIISHRTGKVQSDRPRPILVRLANHITKLDLLMTVRADKKTRHSVLSGISIIQELTQIRSKIAYKARQLYRERKIKGTWVLEGKIVVVDKNDSRHFIRNPEEFLDILTGLGIPPYSDETVPKSNLQNSETQDLESGLKYH